MVAEVGSSGTEMYYEQFLTQVLHWRLVSALADDEHVLLFILYYPIWWHPTPFFCHGSQPPSTPTVVFVSGRWGFPLWIRGLLVTVQCQTDK
jgi:hypothetical protein